MVSFNKIQFPLLLYFHIRSAGGFVLCHPHSGSQADGTATINNIEYCLSLFQRVRVNMLELTLALKTFTQNQHTITFFFHWPAQVMLMSLEY